ncbi:MAG: hypothetical protein GX224_00545 [Thermoplasmatales archaeon]|nr:hypothetical protein [Thermoplasmatales archaeon]
MRRVDLVDIISVATFLVLIAMSVIAYVEDVRLNYQVNTGLFSAFFCLLPMLLKRARLITFPLPLVLMIEASIFLHGYGVLLLKYDYIMAWDTVTHTISSVTIAICIFVVLLIVNEVNEDVEMTPGFLAVATVVIMMAFGAVWEVFELFADSMWGLNMQYSPWDTVRDLASDLAGSVAVAVPAYFYVKKHGYDGIVERLRLSPKLARLVAFASG